LYWIKQLKHENSNGTMKEGKKESAEEWIKYNTENK
jgi:hypothetical protein